MDQSALTPASKFARFLVIVGLSVLTVILTWLDARMIGLIINAKGNEGLLPVALIVSVEFTFISGIILLRCLWGHISEVDYNESPKGHFNISPRLYLSGFGI